MQNIGNEAYEDACWEQAMNFSEKSAPRTKSTWLRNEKMKKKKKSQKKNYDSLCIDARPKSDVRYFAIMKEREREMRSSQEQCLLVGRIKREGKPRGLERKNGRRGEESWEARGGGRTSSRDSHLLARG